MNNIQAQIVIGSTISILNKLNAVNSMCLSNDQRDDIIDAIRSCGDILSSVCYGYAKDKFKK